VTPLYPQKLALTSPTGGGRSVGMVRSRTKATEFSFRKILVKYYSDYLKVGLIPYDCVGIVSAFVSYTIPPGERKVYSQTYFAAGNHIIVNKEVSMVTRNNFSVREYNRYATNT